MRTVELGRLSGILIGAPLTSTAHTASQAPLLEANTSPGWLGALRLSGLEATHALRAMTWTGWDRRRQHSVFAGWSIFAPRATKPNGMWIMQHLMFERGQEIFAEGEPSDLTYRILAGSVDITVATAGGGGRRIASLGPDDIFGEMGIIDDSPRSATATAREQTACQAYSSEEVIELLSSSPEEAIDLIRSLILRLRTTNRKLASNTETKRQAEPPQTGDTNELG